MATFISTEAATRLERYVQQNEVILPASKGLVEGYGPYASLHDKVVRWLEENVGESRNHPIYEAYTGWLDYIDGDWAWRWVCEQKLGFWFEDKRKMLLFKMTWS